MIAEKSYARLGLFVVVTLVVVLATAVFFIQRLRSRAAIAMVSYTNENVSGLDISSPVRLHGVPVGRVTDVRVGLTGQTIEIDFEVFLDRLSTIGVDVKKIRKTVTAGYVFPNLRSQIVPNLVSGEAYLLLDQPKNPPPPMDLGFTPTKPYVPSIPSMGESIQAKLPPLLDRTETSLRTLEEVVARIPDTLNRGNQFFDDIERIAKQSELPALSSDSRKFFATSATQMEQMRSDLDRTEGTLAKLSDDVRAALKDADLPAASQAAREAADSARIAAESARIAEEDLRRSLPAIRDTLQQMREDARELQEQPESVVYGRRPTAEKH
jgi:paraquat-inducible protein B